MRRLPDPPLSLIVFVVGLAILGAEIAAARLLAPYFGASTIVWANTIGIVLVALSAGYWYGGRLADRNPTREGLYRIVLLSGLLLAAVPFVADPFLGVAIDALDSISAGAFVGSLLGVTVLVATPVLVSGAVAPYALRLAVADVAEAGTVVDRERIMREVWDTNWYGSTKTLDMHVSWLRRKLGESAVRAALPAHGARRRRPADSTPRHMRRQLIIGAAAVTITVLVAFVVPLGVAVRVPAANRRLNAAQQTAQSEI
ncbi:MAG: fused MFS/spermidine synthase, partial [Actinobacteria bacterium]|nr:fused MFS/spermidine synthase [Actinomycetota bacterium]